MTSKDILVLDNDECLGNFATSSLIASIYVHYVSNTFNPPRGDCPLHEYYANMLYPFMNTFVNYLEKGIARPYLKEFIQKIYELKCEGKIKKVVMYTAAPNTYGWVTFLSKLIPTYAGVPLDFYDLVLPRSHTVFRRNAYIKSLHIIDRDTSRIVMVDDSPENIIHNDSTIIPVTKYRHHVGLLSHNFLDDMDESYHPTAIHTIQEDERIYIPCDMDYSSDCELLSIIDQLDQLFK